MTDVGAIVPVPPSGLRWRDEGPLEATLRRKRAAIAFHLLGAAWNFTIGFVVLGALSFAPPPFFALFRYFALAAIVFFLLMAARAAVGVTRIRFAGGQLSIRSPLTPFARLNLPMAEIARFDVVSLKDDGEYQVVALLTGGTQHKLPIDLEGMSLKTNWRKEKLFTAPVSHASFVASRMTEMLDAARRSGHDTYRT